MEVGFVLDVFVVGVGDGVGVVLVRLVDFGGCFEDEGFVCGGGFVVVWWCFIVGLC